MSSAKPAMTAPSTTERRARGRVPRWVRVILSSLVTVFALLALGAHLPAVPVVGILGSGLSGLAATLALVGVVVTVPLVVDAVRSRARSSIVFSAIGLLAVVGLSIVSVRIITFGAEHGVSVNPFGQPQSASPPDEYVSYSDRDGAQLRMSVWGPPGAGPAPVALFVHGGGWIAGSPDDGSGNKRWLADQGWLVLSADYSLSSDERHLWDTTEDQIGCAMAWVTANAAAHGGDPSRLAVLGDSAGGNVAINVAYRANASEAISGASQLSCGGTLPHVSAVATVYPAVDPVGFHENSDLLLGATARSMAESYLGGSPAQYPERYAAVTSANLVGPEAPPTLVMTAANDHLVPIAGALEFVEHARREGVDATVVTMPYAEHIFDTVGTGNQVYLEITHDWLVQHLSTS